MLSEEEAIEKLKQCNTRDFEANHINADKILCQFLFDRGYIKIVEAWRTVQPKHYA